MAKSKRMEKRMKNQKEISIHEVIENMGEKPSFLQDLVTYRQDENGVIFKSQNGLETELYFEKIDGRYTFDIMELIHEGNYRDWYIFDHSEMIELENAYNTFIATNARSFPDTESPEFLNNVMSMAIKYIVMRNQSNDDYEREALDVAKYQNPELTQLVNSFSDSPVIEIAKQYSNQQLYSFLD